MFAFYGTLRTGDDIQNNYINYHAPFFIFNLGNGYKSGQLDFTNFISQWHKMPR